MERADSYASLEAPVVVASVQTLMRAKRRERFRHDHFSLIVVDEAHHALADSYRSTIGYFTDDSATKLLGVTATPDRGDRKNLGRLFEAVAFECSLVRLVKEGYLSPLRVKTLPVKVSLAGCKRSLVTILRMTLGPPLSRGLRRSPPKLRLSVGGGRPSSFCPWSRPLNVWRKYWGVLVSCRAQ